MAAQILITMDDLETAVRSNAALEAAGLSTAMFSSLDDARGAVRRENPDLVVITGAVHDAPNLQLAALARDAEISTLALLEPTDSERGERVARLGVTEVLVKPVPPDEVAREYPGQHGDARARRSGGEQRVRAVGREHDARAGEHRLEPRRALERVVRRRVHE